jgi:predicted phage terminase large subunit-like protein
VGRLGGAAPIDLWPEEDLRTGVLGTAYDAAVEQSAQSGLPSSPAMSLLDFVREGWDVLEPGTAYRHGWHIEAICEHLEAVSMGQIRDLLITIPPGHSKSLIVSVFWPAWTWQWNPTWRGIFSSYDATLAIRDSVKTRQLLESDWFLARFEPRWQFSTDQNVKSYFQNSDMGFRLSLSVGGKGTGFRGSCVVVDDPLNAEDRFSSLKRHQSIRWWDTTMSSRLSNQETGSRVIIMQRLHEEDLAGHVIEKGGYQHLNLPSEFEPDRAARTSIGWSDPRKKAGELLFPELFPPAVIAQVKKDLGSLDYAAQHQQRPTAIEGSLFKRGWWKYYDVAPMRFEQVALSLDCSFKDTTSGSFVVFQVWGKLGADMYLLSQVRCRLDFPNTIAAFRWLLTAEPSIGPKYVEDKANGPAVIATLRRQVPGIVAVPAEQSKEARWAAASPYVEAGNVWLPAKRAAERWASVLREAARTTASSWLHLEDVSDNWVTEFVDELSGVPTSRYDDQADAAAQAILRLVVNVRSDEAPPSHVMRTFS